MILIGNLVPLHTGQGADFQLALLGDEEYRNLYMMREVLPEHWKLLPDVLQELQTGDGAIRSALVSKEQADKLHEMKLIPGLINSCDASLYANTLSGWSATEEIRGLDGTMRRWVYLHFFKPTQPTLNLDHPDCQAMRLVNGLSLNELKRGATGLRLDAIPFSVEGRADDAQSNDVYTPSAIRKANQIACLIRRAGGFTFQELMSPLSVIREFIRNGADLSYDFFTRTPYLHAVLTGDASLLRLSFEMLLDAGIQPCKLVHDLQNHDELTYQLPELSDHRCDEWLRFCVDRKSMRGLNIHRQVLKQMHDAARGNERSFKLYRPAQDGIATTMVGFIAAGLGVKDLYDKPITPDEVNDIRRAHLLIAWINAMQPGVFGLSIWDLVGAFPLDADDVQVNQQIGERFRDGDYRWLNRGGVDLLGANNDAKTSALGLPVCKNLYGPVREQLKSPHSFASVIKRMLTFRDEHGIADMEVVSPLLEPENIGVCVLVMRSADRVVVTAVNFGRDKATESFDWKMVLGPEQPYFSGKAAFRLSVGSENSVKIDVPRKRRLDFDLRRLDAETIVFMGDGNSKKTLSY